MRHNSTALHWQMANYAAVHAMTQVTQQGRAGDTDPKRAQLATLEEIDVTQHGLPDGQLCHGTSDSKSAPKNVQVLLPAHARAAVTAFASQTIGSMNHPFAVTFYMSLHKRSTVSRAHPTAIIYRH